MVCKNLRECRSFDVTIIWNSEEVLYVRAKKKKKEREGKCDCEKKTERDGKGKNSRSVCSNYYRNHVCDYIKNKETI